MVERVPHKHEGDCSIQSSATTLCTIWLRSTATPLPGGLTKARPNPWQNVGKARTARMAGRQAC